MSTPLEQLVKATEKPMIERARKIISHDTAALRTALNQLQKRAQEETMTTPREQLTKEAVIVYIETPWNPAGSHPTRKDAIKRVILFLETQGWTPPPTPAHNTTTEN